ncbi:spherulin-1A [Cadophora sp. MPI-SDFR-AT-0126]|nr:spherulin-1A [Leotiomycetes sp. MPI-SDFR-AT-0126]
MFATTLRLLALCGFALGAPTQEPLNTPAEIKDSPEFPLPPPLPFNGTIPGVDYDLIAKLKTSPNAVTRLALLKDSDFAFDFISPPNIPGIEFRGEGGFFVNAQGLSMPALIENGMALSVAFTKPCGFNTPHTHPSATELALVVKGRMITEFVLGTGARKIRNEHNTWGMAVFPQGSLHLEFNPDCTDMIFIAAFNSEDPGANFPAETLFQLDDDFAGLALGLEFLPGADIDKFRHLVPATLAQGVDSCLRRCGIKKNEL